MKFKKSHLVILVFFVFFIGATPEPKLSVVSAASGGVTLQCEANYCWQPQPEITFVDDQGNDIRAEEPKRGGNHTGCFNISRRVTLQTATNRFKFSSSLKNFDLPSCQRPIC